MGKPFFTWDAADTAIKGDGTFGLNLAYLLVNGAADARYVAPNAAWCVQLNAYWFSSNVTETFAYRANKTWNESPNAAAKPPFSPKDVLQATHPTQRVIMFKNILRAPTQYFAPGAVTPVDGASNDEGYTWLGHSFRDWFAPPNFERFLLLRPGGNRTCSARLLDDTIEFMKLFAVYIKNDITDLAWVKFDDETPLQDYIIEQMTRNAYNRNAQNGTNYPDKFDILKDVVQLSKAVHSRLPAEFRAADKASADVSYIPYSDYPTARDTENNKIFRKWCQGHLNTSLKKAVLKPLANELGEHWIDPSVAKVTQQNHFVIRKGLTQQAKSGSSYQNLGPWTNGHEFCTPHLSNYSTWYYHYEFLLAKATGDAYTGASVLNGSAAGWSRALTTSGTQVAYNPGGPSATKVGAWNTTIVNLNLARFYVKGGLLFPHMSAVYGYGTAAGRLLTSAWTESDTDKIMNARAMKLWQTNLIHLNATGGLAGIMLFNQSQQRFSTNLQTAYPPWTDSPSSQWMHTDLFTSCVSARLMAQFWEENIANSQPSGINRYLKPIPLDADSIVTIDVDGVVHTTLYTDIFNSSITPLSLI